MEWYTTRLWLLLPNQIPPANCVAIIAPPNTIASTGTQNARLRASRKSNGASQEGQKRKSEVVHEGPR